VEAACTQHKVPPHEVAILTLDAHKEGSPWHLASLGGQLTSDSPQEGHVTLTTVRRFKGLEAALVVVADVDFANATSFEWRRRLYVACSRARHAVHLITTTKESALAEAIASLAGTTKARATWRTLARTLGVRICDQHTEDLKTMRAYERFEIPG
jgi:superfamily I DNA/RNA helicase